jgi:hypothetical protein
MTNETQIVTKYDRIYGGLQDVSLSTKASTVKTVQAVTGKSESFIVQTLRHEELGDFIFIEHLDENGVVRLALPPKVANLIASQRDALTARRRSISSRRVMRERMASGNWKPPVPPQRRKKA